MARYRTWKIREDVHELKAPRWQIDIPQRETIYGGLSHIAAALLLSATGGSTTDAEALATEAAAIIRRLEK